MFFFFFFQAEDGIRDADVTGVQTCALPIYGLGLQLVEIIYVIKFIAHSILLFARSYLSLWTSRRSRLMQAAFFFAIVFPPPSARAEVFTGPDRPGTGCTADAHKAFIVERIVRDVVPVDVGLHRG